MKSFLWLGALGIWVSLMFSAAAQPARYCNSGYLGQTLSGKSIVAKPLPFFANPDQHKARWQAIDHYFKHRFGFSDILNASFAPQALVLHSTESENEAGVYNTFANDKSPYLGGVWTTFAVDSDGTVYQYSPLDRFSKGQAGLNDLAVGIEIVGTASGYNQAAQRQRVGSIAKRYEAKNSAQLQAVIALTRTLQHCLDIPTPRVFSHEEIAQIKHLSGQSPVDYDWLKAQIKDAVYLGQKPLLNAAGQPLRTYGLLEPYGRSDPGLDVMQYVRRFLNQQDRGFHE